MFIKRTSRRAPGGKTYVNHLLVESVATEKGPRHRVICSLGNLAPAPVEEWRGLSRRLASALSPQAELWTDTDIEPTADKARRRSSAEPSAAVDLVTIHTDRVAIENAREAGPVHVGHQMWQRLDLDAILAGVGFSERARRLTEIMTLNRLVSPMSEHAMPDWIQRTALADILTENLSAVGDDVLYRHLDTLHPVRAAIETALAEREKSLFNLDDSILLYDLTSTFFEGACEANPQARRGYSRDQRPDCKQVVIGLVLDRDGFPKAHEVFDGNRIDRTTLDDMLGILEARTGRHGGATVVVDRGMAYDENLAQIRQRGHHYLVAARQPERLAHESEFSNEEGWTDILRATSPLNPSQKKSRVLVKKIRVGDEVHILCKGEGRVAKDRAIRVKHERRLIADLEKLEARVVQKKIRKPGKIHEAIGRLKERHSRVARYYDMVYDATREVFSWSEIVAMKESAARLDGAYLLKTDRTDLTDDELWRTYILLTRVEAAFRAMKSPLAERPIFHHLENRVQTHVFLCVLAYHLLISIEKTCLDAGVHTSWATLRDELRTHQVATLVLPASDGRTLRVRRATTPERRHEEIYRTLRIPSEVMKPIKTWAAKV